MTDIDINKAIAAGEPGVDPDVLARTQEISDWSRDKAIEMAKVDGLALGEDHWRVIEFLRNTYVERGPAEGARHIAGLLNETFEAQGGSKFLYQLFPGGPVSQGSRLAGVPVPHDAQSQSFGSSF